MGINWLRVAITLMLIGAAVVVFEKLMGAVMPPLKRNIGM